MSFDDDMSPAELERELETIFDGLHCVGMILREFGYRVRVKPLIGGPFGHGAFSLASVATAPDGLDRVDYFVLHSESRFPIGFCDSKQEALKFARGLLRIASPSRVAAEWEKFRAACEEKARQKQAAREGFALARKAEDAARPKVASIPRRRQRIFDESGGKCHYCATALTLDGKWHIEHKMPKALGGGNEPGNLVASCVNCNHKKRDTTDVEFKARLARETTQ